MNSYAVKDPTAPGVVVILVTYGGSADAIECISTLMSSDYPNLKIILCDNDSPDDTYEEIKEWTQANTSFAYSSEFLDLSFPIPDHKPETREFAENHNFSNFDEMPYLTLVKSSRNGGYSAGNNICLKMISKAAGWKWAWILNPDTLVPENTLSELVQKGQQTEKCGIVGAKLVYANNTNTVQCLGGGAYRPVTGFSRNIGMHSKADTPVNETEIENQLDYINGASMLANREFIENIGLLEEKYFLYFEELDWCTRGKDYNLAYSDKSIVYHKHGGAVGGAKTAVKHEGGFTQYCGFRSRRLFAQKFYPHMLPVLWFTTLYFVLQKTVYGRPDLSWLIFKTMFPIPNSKYKIPGT